MRLKVGVVGTGKMGGYHLQKLSQMSNVELVGFYDIHDERRESIAQKYSTKAFKDLNELFFEIDAVVIASPTPFHFAQAKGALEQGVSVLVEKPITLHAYEAEILIELAQQKKLVLQVGFIERFRMHALFEKNYLPQIHFIECHRLATRAGRETEIDVVSDLMIHDLDLVIALFGEEPTGFMAYGASVKTNQWDLANVRLEFPSGRMANLHASRVAHDQVRTAHLSSSKGYVHLDWVENEAKYCFKKENHQLQWKEHALGAWDALKVQDEHFIECVRESKTPNVTGFDGLRSLRAVKKILEHLDYRRDQLQQVPMPEAYFDRLETT